MEAATDIGWLTRRPIAHRGLHDGNRLRWENTLSAFEAAVAAGCAIECDVHLSADGVPVVFHDDELERLTGRQGSVHSKTAAELGEMAIGGTRDRIPTLAQVLDVVAARVPLVIELKASSHQAGLAEAVGGVLSGYRGEVALMSFDHDLIRDLRAHVPDRPRGLTAEGTGERMLEAHFSMLAHEIAFVSYSVDDLPNRFVSFVRERLAIPVITWTVRNPAQVATTRRHADQMTFEGFEPGDLAMQHGNDN